MKFFLIAGEASGDMHAANLIKAISDQQPDAVFMGLGGDKMRAAGATLFQDYRQMAYMGVVDVLANLGKVKENLILTKKALIEHQPDILILIDYPSFNLRIAKFCRQHLPQTKICYYIPPKCWAWKKWRIHTIAHLCDLVLGIFPFETDFYAQYGYQCHYVGNPTMDVIRLYKQAHTVEQRLPIIAILPGSRKGEITACLPVMLQAARRFTDYQICVAAAPGIDRSLYNRYLTDKETLTTDTYDLLSHASAAVVNSGTATLETALLDCPQTSVYHIVMGKILWFFRFLLFRTPFFTLVNIIPQKAVIKELFAYLFTAENIEKELHLLLTNQQYISRMRSEYTNISRLLGDTPAAQSAAVLILKLQS